MTSEHDNSTLVAHLEAKARTLRLLAIEMIYRAGSGHPGGSLSAAEIVAVVYYRLLRHNPRRPHWPERDRFILSKGHAAPIVYAALADQGYFAKEELLTLRQVGSMLQGHPCRSTPGIEASGSLGHGLSIACGICYAAQKLDSNDQSAYVLLGDGELGEGQVWEAAMFASHNGLENLIAIVDRNGLQHVGATEEVLRLEPLAEKWIAFGWHVEEVFDGHDIGSLLRAFARARAVRGRPKVIIARTVKGKGVSFMENDLAWHGTAPDAGQFVAALRELSKNRRG